MPEMHERQRDDWDRLRYQSAMPSNILDRTAPVRVWTAEELEDTINKLKHDNSKNEIKIRRLEHTLEQFDLINKELVTLVTTLLDRVNAMDARDARLTPDHQLHISAASDRAVQRNSSNASALRASDAPF